jgi:hypothetical protein
MTPAICDESDQPALESIRLLTASPGQAGAAETGAPAETPSGKPRARINKTRLDGALLHG